MELKEADLLQWCIKFTKGHDHITPATDLCKCWEDGTLFCALLYNWYPKKIPIHALLVRESRDDKLNNLRLAFTVCEETGTPWRLDCDAVGCFIWCFLASVPLCFPPFFLPSYCFVSLARFLPIDA
jgi:hypothetical protein